MPPLPPPTPPHALGSDYVRDQLRPRSRELNRRVYRPDGEYVLYWMQATHRLEENWALRGALRAANRLNLPLVIHQGLDPTYPHAADRHHTFILQGARDTARHAERLGLHYQFVLRRRRDDDRRVVDRLASRAYVVITDLFPTAGIRERSERFAERCECRVIAVESSCTVPHGLFERPEFAARTIRPKLARLVAHAIEPVEALSAPSSRDGGARCAVNASLRATLATLTGVEPLPIGGMSDAEIAAAVASCEIDHTVPALAIRGGSEEAAARLEAFVARRLPRYGDTRNEAGDAEGTSGLSPWLHFGHVAAAETVRRALASGAPATSIDPFVQQVTTWRELSFNWCIHTRHYDALASLPEWVRKTMAAHERDPRPALYDRDALERGETADPLWNAAQQQLRTEGIIHNYPRMLWGKTVLLWTPTYEEARATLFHLNDKWAIDGRDPNSVGGIMWCLGLWDRPWGNKAVWGGIRPMVTSRARLKFDVARYIARVTAPA